MQYYDSSIMQKSPEVLHYFQKAIEKNHLAHCLLFWGADITFQCAIALEIARLLNCKEKASADCECLNCRWIREQTHPAVKIYTRLDFKEIENSTDEEGSSAGKKNINVAQARSIISELAISSDYHRVYIFCDRDEDGNLLPLNQLNFPEVTSNALLKTFEEPPQNTIFIFLTKSKTDVISTVVSRAQSFFIPSVVEQNINYELVNDVISEYWTFEKSKVLEFSESIYNLAIENEPSEVFGQIENYMRSVMKVNFGNKQLFYKLLEDINYVETAKRQIELKPPMNLSAVCENLSFKLFL